MRDGGVHVTDVERLQGMELGAGVQALGEGVQVEAGRQRTRGERLVLRVSPKNSMDASKESCHERLDLVNALGTDVVPEVRPIRKGVSGGPSWSSVGTAGPAWPVQLPAAQASG